jgi:hypothetical protein
MSEQTKRADIAAISKAMRERGELGSRPRKRRAVSDFNPLGWLGGLGAVSLLRKAERAANLRPLAAIQLHCLMCMGGSAAEVKRCTSKDCPLWPWANKAENTEEIPDG